MTLNHDRLAKLLALAGSNHDGEATAALRKAGEMLKAAGLSFTDVAERLKEPAAPTVQTGHQQHGPARTHSFDFGEWMEAREPGWKAQQAAQHAERNRQRAEARRLVLERYGSEEAAIARDPREQALHDGALPWLESPVEQEEPHLAGRWHNRMGGWSLNDFRGDPVEPCRAAIMAALPLPTSLRAAREEVRAWEARNDELCAILENWGEIHLDLPAAYRMGVVRRMYERDMPIATLDDLLVRLEFADGCDDTISTCDAVPSILDAFRKLVVQGEVPAPVHSGQPARAADRRAAVLTLLSSPDTAAWSDRAIARATGVSPTTVGALRRASR